MKSPYERPSIRTESEGVVRGSGGNPNRGAQECHVFLGGIFKEKKTNVYLFCQ